MYLVRKTLPDPPMRVSGILPAPKKRAAGSGTLQWQAPLAVLTVSQGHSSGAGRGGDALWMCIDCREEERDTHRSVGRGYRSGSFTGSTK